MASNQKQEATINVPFRALLEHNEQYFCYVDHPHTSISTYSTASKAKAKFKAQLIEEVNEALKQKASYETRLVGAGDGSVFLVRYIHGSWGHSIAGPGRKYAGSSAGAKSFEAALTDAKKMAEEAFGGVAWECSG